MFPVDNFCNNSSIWQTTFYHQYMQQHAAMTQWIQQFHQNIPQNSDYMNAYGAGWSQHPTNNSYNYEDYPSEGQPTHPLYENTVSTEISYSESGEIVPDDDDDEVHDDSDESECEYEFNVDAILAMRAAKEELDKVSEEESDGSFVVIETEKEEFDFVELGSLKTLESKRAKDVGCEDAHKEFNTEKEIMNHLYGEKAATISGMETAMSVTFEHFCDKHQPPLWPVLPVRLLGLKMIFKISLFLAAVCATSVTSESKCASVEMAKAETYLETAAAIIDRLRENLPEAASGGDCSCPPKPMGCDEVFRCGQNRSGVYQIWPRNRIMVGSINVFCDMETNGGGWTLIQRRGDYHRPKDFFHKRWHHYKTGFGDLRRDFWLGNENIYALTNQKKYYLRIDLVDFENNTRYAFYDQFWIDNESQNYKLHVYDFSGDAGDSLSKVHDGAMFSTMDRDNDNSTENCALKHSGGWWFNSCLLSNLNGLYNGATEKSADGLLWSSWKNNFESLQISEMKIRSVDFQTDMLDMDVEPA